MRRHAPNQPSRQLLAVAAALVAVSAAHLVAASPAHAATPSLTAIARLAAPVLEPEAQAPADLSTIDLGAHIEVSDRRGTTGVLMLPQQQDPLPPVRDPQSGAVLSILGGSVVSGSSAFQGGAAFAYFFGEKANYGFEVEGNMTFGPGGRVSQGMGSFVWQFGARTSKFVPYFAGGLGYMHATSSLPSQTQEVLDEFDIDPEPKEEEGPFFHYGGGLRFYIGANLAFRADVRFASVPLNLEIDPGFRNRLYAITRIAGMLSFDF